MSIDTVATITPTEDTVAAGDVVGTTTGSDVDGGTITYSIDDTTNYAIDPVTGEVTLTQAGADLVNAGEDLLHIQSQVYQLQATPEAIVILRHLQ